MMKRWGEGKRGVFSSFDNKKDDSFEQEEPESETIMNLDLFLNAEYSLLIRCNKRVRCAYMK